MYGYIGNDDLNLVLERQGPAAIWTKNMRQGLGQLLEHAPDITYSDCVIFQRTNSHSRCAPKEDEVFQFTVDGLVRYARLTTPARALEILVGLPDAAPFESLKDALVAWGEPEQLHRLAPERQSVAMELMRRLKAPIT